MGEGVTWALWMIPSGRMVQSSALHGAQHGDKVSVRLIHGDRAEVVRILSRGNTVMIGTALRDGNRVLFIPDNQNYFSNVVLSDKGVKDGEKVAIKIDEYPRTSQGCQR